MIKCPNCGYEQKTSGRYCVSCKFELKSFDKKFERKALLKFLLIYVWSMSGLIIWVWFRFFSGINTELDLRDYVLTAGMVILNVTLVLFPISFFLRARKKLKKEDYQNHDGKKLVFNNSVKDTSDIQDNEHILDEISYMTLLPGNSLCNLYFTDKRLIIFSLSGISNSVRIKKIKEFEKEITPLKNDIKKLIDFYPLNLSIKYSNIVKVIIRKRDITMEVRISEGEKNFNISLLIMNYDRKNKRWGMDYAPVFAKYLSSKLFDKKGDYIHV